MLPYFSGGYANPHSEDHSAGWAASQAIEAAREQVACAVGAEPSEIVFTSGATESNNLALLGAAAADGERGAIVVSAIEHKSVLAIGRALQRAGRELRVVPVDESGLLNIDALAAAIYGDVTIVSIGAVNNEIGVVQDMAAVADLCRSRGALLHSDVTQGVGWSAVDVETMGVDLASFSAHKLRGPKGIGALFVSLAATDRIAPVMHGGGQERGLRPGTLPTPLCVGFGAACTLLPNKADVESWRLVTRHLLNGVEQLFPNLILNGAGDPRHPGNLNFRVPGIDAQLLVARAQPHVALSRGAACTSGIPEQSHVLRAIGLSEEEADASIRLSTGLDTTFSEIDAAIVELAKAAYLPESL
ncbi:cysteine desulfurase [Methylobacterium brachiatum]|nr:cysteine desulfurase [Methylobacterium brachiatum]